MFRFISIFMALLTAFPAISSSQNLVRIVASDGEGDDEFGGNVSISGDYAIVGASGEGEFAFERSGAAYIFKREVNDWIEVIKLKASDAESKSSFGSAVSISGDYAVVGAVFSDANGNQSGAAYIFERIDDNWVEANRLLASDGMSGHGFGASVSIDREHTFIAAARGTGPGWVYVFEREASGWIETQKLTADDIDGAEDFGWVVSISRDYGIVADRYDDNANGIDAGAVHVFKREDSGWTKVKTLIASDGDHGEEFGYAAAIDGDYIVIGKSFDEMAGGGKGAVYIFQRAGEDWIEKSKLSASSNYEENDYGGSVAISGDYVLVADAEDSDKGEDSGAVYVYRREGNTWKEINKLTPQEGDKGLSHFRESLAIDGNSTIVGLPRNDAEYTGAAYVIDLALSTFVESPMLEEHSEVLQSTRNYPNPFSQATNIEYVLQTATHVRLEVYTLLGRRIAILEDKMQSPGHYQISWRPKGLPAGSYIYRISTGQSSSARLVTLI